MYAVLSDTARHTGEHLGARQVAQAYKAPDFFFLRRTHKYGTWIVSP